MAAYTISVNTAATATTVEDSAGWKSDMERIEAAAAAHPLVWTERDKGWGDRANDRPTPKK